MPGSSATTVDMSDIAFDQPLLLILHQGYSRRNNQNNPSGDFGNRLIGQARSGIGTRNNNDVSFSESVTCFDGLETRSSSHRRHAFGEAKIDR